MAKCNSCCGRSGCNACSTSCSAGASGRTPVGALGVLCRSNRGCQNCSSNHRCGCAYPSGCLYPCGCLNPCGCGNDACDNCDTCNSCSSCGNNHAACGCGNGCTTGCHRNRYGTGCKPCNCGGCTHGGCNSCGYRDPYYTGPCPPAPCNGCGCPAPGHCGGCHHGCHCGSCSATVDPETACCCHHRGGECCRCGCNPCCCANEVGCPEWIEEAGSGVFTVGAPFNAAAGSTVRLHGRDVNARYYTVSDGCIAIRKSGAYHLAVIVNLPAGMEADTVLGLELDGHHLNPPELPISSCSGRDYAAHAVIHAEAGSILRLTTQNHLCCTESAVRPIITLILTRLTDRQG